MLAKRRNISIEEAKAQRERHKIENPPKGIGATGPSITIFRRLFKYNCIEFDHVYAWEKRLYPKWWDRVPEAEKPHVTFYNEPVNMSDASALGVLAQTARPEDFVVFKLDIDYPPLEREIIDAFLNRPGLAALVDELFFEYPLGQDGLGSGPRASRGAQEFAVWRGGKGGSRRDGCWLGCVGWASERTFGFEYCYRTCVCVVYLRTSRGAYRVYLFIQCSTALQSSRHASFFAHALAFRVANKRAIPSARATLKPSYMDAIVDRVQGSDLTNVFWREDDASTPHAVCGAPKRACQAALPTLSASEPSASRALARWRLSTSNWIAAPSGVPITAT